VIPRFPGEAPRDHSKPLEQIRLLADDRHDGQRLEVHELIRDGYVELQDGRAPRPSRKIRQGDVIVVRIPPQPVPDEVFPDDFEVPILFEDPHCVVVDKPAGLAVHPAGRRVHGTLIHFLHRRYRRPEDPAHDVVPRLLHRIDRETSGVLAVGLDDTFHAAVRRQFEDRQVEKVYLAVVHGRPSEAEGRIELSIGPDRKSPVRLKLEARRDGSGLPASTRYRTVRTAGAFSLVELFPETGRTHQLRVHMDAIGCPLVGDKVYGVPPEVFLDYLDDEEALAHRERLILSRHALHASRLTFRHPGYAEPFTVEAPLPADMAALVGEP
jgi:23S rRNA pseudouridine1911/1915/1917 synthase